MTDLTERAAAVDRPDDSARLAVRNSDDPARGRLADLAEWLAGVQGRAPARPPARVRAVVLGDTVPDVTAAAADDVGAATRLVTSHGAPESAHTTDACTFDEALAAVRAGVALADEEADGGADLLVLAIPGPGLAVPVASLIGLLTSSDAAAVTATGQDDDAWMRACAATRDTMRRGRRHRGDQVRLLAAVAGPDLAFASGLLLGAAARRTPVVLDGPATAAAGLVAARQAFRAPDWWLAGAVSPDPGHALALARLSLVPVLDLGRRGDDGVGALLAVPVLRAAATTTPDPDRAPQT